MGDDGIAESNREIDTSQVRSAYCCETMISRGNKNSSNTAIVCGSAKRGAPKLLQQESKTRDEGENEKRMGIAANVWMTSGEEEAI